MNFLIWKRRNPQKIPPPAGESRALPKYFEHAGALLTADGTDDDKIKPGGVANGQELSIYFSPTQKR